MPYIPKTIQQPRYQLPGGYYHVHPIFHENSNLRNWIESLDFEQYETKAHQFGKYSRKRNQLYLIDLPFLGGKQLLKVSTISPSYGFWRRLNLHITSWFKDYNLNAFYASLGFESHQIDCLHCIAQWNYRSSSKGKKSYLLYNYIEADFTVADLIKQLPKSQSSQQPLIDSIGSKIGAIIHQIHAANMRHGDPHAGNFLIPQLQNKDLDQLTAESIKSLNFVLIDLDKSEFSQTSSVFIKKFLDLRCLRRLRVADKIGVDALTYYCGTSCSPNTRRIVSFWQRGGFNLYKQLRRNRIH